MARELSIIAPTFNEAGNVEILADRLAAVLQGVDWELLFVDDNSPDGTALKVGEVGQRMANVRCLGGGQIRQDHRRRCPPAMSVGV
jgi:dolichol-phosphate mannosyltransferase